MVKVIERLLVMGAMIPDEDPDKPGWKAALRPIITNLLRPSRQEEQLIEARAQLVKERARMEEARVQLNEAVGAALQHRS